MSLNAYQAHAQGLQQLQAELATNDLLANGGSGGGFVIYAQFQNPIPALVGPFQISQELTPEGGGFTQHLEALVILQKTDVIGAPFHTGQNIQVRAPLSDQRACQIKAVSDDFTTWRLLVQAEFEGA